jgi:two-component system, LytTR family, sensor kinase
MKVRWKQHEMIFFAILMIVEMVASCKKMYEPSTIDYAIRFKENGISFIYWRNVLFPQMLSLLLMYTGYLAVNQLVLPLLKKIEFEDFEKLLSLKLLKVILAIGIVSYLLSLGVNICSYYANPHFFSYGGYQFLALLGYNDNPLSNIFFGFERALGIVLLITTLSGLRDLISWLIEKPWGKREYRLLIVNNTTPLVLIYFLVLYLINPRHDDFLKYVVFATPLIALYVCLTFWIFPFKDDKKIFDKSILARLLAVTFVCIVPSLFLLATQNKFFVSIFYWLFLLFVATPLFWILYKQRKDKIMQWKNMEKALAASDANLQFLRSQINPHFLFNALNTLYGTALKGDTDKTADGIQKLGDMMRFMLHENTLDFIPMDKELEYLKNFIELQKLRTQSSSDISIEENIAEVSSKNRIAPMLLIPFVENAFKHGISLQGKSWIKIDLTRIDNVLFFEVKNSVHTNKGNLEKGKSGIGLSNVKDRLKLQYPDKHLLKIDETENEFTVKLVLTC